METSESKPEKNRLEEMQETIANAATRIEAEFARTANDWLSCFGSSVFVVETYLASPKLEAMLSPEQYRRALQRMQHLKDGLYKLKQQYPDKGTVPPDSIKENLLRELDILREVD